MKRIKVNIEHLISYFDKVTVNHHEITIESFSFSDIEVFAILKFCKDNNWMIKKIDSTIELSILITLIPK